MERADRKTEALLERIERYYDAVPRLRARAEDIGPFTLFVADTGWPCYARPRLDAPDLAGVDDVRAVLGRQAELDVPQSLEWMHEMSPSLLETARDVGMTVEVCPLLVLEGAPRGCAGRARLLDPDDPGDLTDLALSRAAVAVAFENPGTATGSAGIAERDQRLTTAVAAFEGRVCQPTRQARLRQAAVYDAASSELGPVGGGSHTPVDHVAEIAGVGVLPAYRHRGLARQLVVVLARDALNRGMTTVFCSAQDDDVARVYEAVGFGRVATACIAAVPAARVRAPTPVVPAGSPSVVTQARRVHDEMRQRAPTEIRRRRRSACLALHPSRHRQRVDDTAAYLCDGNWFNDPVSRPLAAAVSVLIVIVAAAAVSGEHWWSGPLLLSATSTHGVHVGDLVVLAMAALAVCWAWRSARP